jgi:hypothetical protein
MDDAFASIAFIPVEGVVFGAYWLSDILETDGYEDFASGAITAGYVYDATCGAGAFLNAQIGSVALNAEYVTALEEVDLPGGELLPMAYNVEASMPIMEQLSAGIKLEGSDDFYSEFAGAPGGKWADWQAGFVVSYDLNEHVTLSGEYLHADGLDDNESGDMVTMQVAVKL